MFKDLSVTSGIPFRLKELQDATKGLRGGDLAVFFARTNCVSGDTKIRVRYNKDSNGSRIYPIRELYKMFNGKHHLKGIGHQVQSCSSDKRVYYNDIEHVTYSGEKEVYLVETERGFKLKATLEHEFLLPDGSYKRLELLAIGDDICTDRTEKFKRQIGGERTGRWPGSPYKYRFIEGKYGPYHRAKVYRLYYDAYQNNLTLDEFLLKLSKGEAPILKFSDQSMDIHHVDMNHGNNNKDNLILMSHDEHLRLHSNAHDNGHSHFVDPDTIKCITLVGVEDCYDLGVMGKNKNFRANGIYIHNCGKSTFLASEITYMAEHVNKPVIYFNNEQRGNAVKLRLIQSSLGWNVDQINVDHSKTLSLYQQKTHGNIKLVDDASLTHWQLKRYVEDLEPSLICIDQLDKIKGFKADRHDLEVGAIYIFLREVAKKYNIPVIGVTQASESAEGKKWLTTKDMAESKTSKAAEADLLVGIGKCNEEGYDTIRYLNILKNKGTGDERKIECRFKKEIGRYESF